MKICLLLILFISPIVYSKSDETVVSQEQSSNKKDIKNSIVKSIINLNKTLPKMVHENIKASAVKLVDKNIIYKYTLIKLSKNEMNISRLIKYEKPTLISKNCVEPNRYFEHNYNFVYHYHDLNDELIGTIIITKEDCLKTKK